LKPSVLITTFTFPPDQNGVAHVAAAHAFGLAARGYPVTVATACNPFRKGCRFPPTVRVMEFDVSGNAHPRVGYRGDVEGYKSFISSFDAEIVMCHCWQIWSTDLAIPAFSSNRGRKILVSHGLSANTLMHFPRSILTYLAWRPYVWKLPKMVQAFDHIVFLSDRMDGDRFYDRSVVHRLGLKNCSIVPNGADPKLPAACLPDFRSFMGIKRERLILNVSNFSQLKNQEMSLRAYFRASPDDAVLVLLGSQMNDYTEHLRNVYAELTRRTRGISPQVHFLGGLERNLVRAAYMAADLFLSSSRTEVQPLAILDAMAAGVPFISTDVGCVDELPGGVIARNEREMAYWINRLLTDRKLSLDLSCKGRSAATRQYSWEKILAKYDELLSSFTSDRRVQLSPLSIVY